jgi:hypothetical protein
MTAARADSGEPFEAAASVFSASAASSLQAIPTLRTHKLFTRSDLSDSLTAGRSVDERSILVDG